MKVGPAISMARRITLLTALFALPLHAAVEARYEPVPGQSKVRVEGTSTLHDWHAESGSIQGHLVLPEDCEAGLILDGAESSAGAERPTIQARIPVNMLKSGKSGLDENMYKALQAKKHPHITYRLKTASVREESSTPQDGATYKLDTTGELTVAGLTRPIEMPFTVRQGPNGRLTMSGTTKLKMTDFKIDPPTAMLGLIKAGDEVRVTVEWVTTRKTPPLSHPVSAAPESHRRAISATLKAYDEVSRALSVDDLTAMNEALKPLADAAEALTAQPTDALTADSREAWREAAESLETAVDRVQEAADDLATARQVFAPLSTALAGIIERFGHAGNQPVLHYRCTAVDPSPSYLSPASVAQQPGPYHPASAHRQPDTLAAIYCAQ